MSSDSSSALRDNKYDTIFYKTLCKYDNVYLFLINCNRTFGYILFWSSTIYYDNPLIRYILGKILFKQNVKKLSNKHENHKATLLTKSQKI